MELYQQHSKHIFIQGVPDLKKKKKNEFLISYCKM